MKTITQWAPAKVNLYLKVLGRRRDGYHDIVTLFERIDIRDKIIISETKSGISVKSTDPILPGGEDNICYKAANLLKKKFNVPTGVKINIIKKIPVAAGLGGGSSDAASTLKGLNKFWSLGLQKKDLINFGKIIGSDVAFFLEDTSFSIGTKRGECLQPVRSDISLWHVIITPNIQLLSGDIYRLYDAKHSLTLTRKRGVDKILFPPKHISNRDELKTLLNNDLEDIVLAQRPIIQEVKKSLVFSGAKKTLVSGSGPSVFGLYGTRKEAVKAKRCCSRRLPTTDGWRIFVAKTY